MSHPSTAAAMTDQTVWITGAGGFIGRALAVHLAGQGARVLGLGHGGPSAGPPGLSHWIAGDVNAEHMDTLLAAGGPPRAVYHLAGGASVGAAEADQAADFHRTVTSTALLLDWLRRASPASRVVAVSSAAVYGAGHAGPIAETALTRPVSIYGRHKLEMETLCAVHAREQGQPIAVGRLFSVYGAGLRKQLLWDLSARLAAAPAVLELSGTGEELRDWTSIDDIVRALPALSEIASSACPTLNVGAGRGVCVRDIAGFALRAWPSRARLSFNGAVRPGDPFSLIADTARLSALGVACAVQAEDGVAGYIAWSRAQMEAAA
jgi:UDP-glucose 4-epimerase